jgi:hypothetical protein
MTIRPGCIAWIALFAMFFSAASPVFAAVVLADNSAAFAKMLGLPAAPEPAAEGEDFAHHGHHGAAAGDHSGGIHESPEHAAHGIYCSFCLNPGSVAAVAPAAVAAAILTLAFDIAAPATRTGYYSRFIAPYRSRAPPASS